MRLFTYLALLVVAILSCGCEKEEAKASPPITFEVVDTWPTFFDAGAPATGPLTIFLPTSRINSAYADSCRRNKTAPERVQQATLRNATLTLQAPAGQNFDSVRQLTVYITSEQGNDRIVLASLPIVPLGATTLTLNPTNEALQNYLRPGQYYLTPQLELRQPGQVLARVQMQLRYQVQAEPL